MINENSHLKQAWQRLPECHEQVSFDQVQQMWEKAIQARSKAYAPYSQFAVGAAVLTALGKIVTGCNIENASFGLSHCAERTALHKAISEADQELDKQIIAVLVLADTDQPLAPCGACRQVMTELCRGEAPVFMGNLQQDVHCMSVNELLPYRFERNQIK